MIKCVVVDDELPAIDVLVTYISQINRCAGSDPG